MLIVGEKINTSRRKVKEAVDKRDGQFIRLLARQQKDAGANMIDVNCGTFIDEEPQLLSWLVREVQDEVKTPLCIDSPNPAAIEAALKAHEGSALVNSISGEKERYSQILPLLKDYNCSVVLLCMDDEHGIPHDFQTRFQIASRLIESLEKSGITSNRIYVDPLIQPVSTDSANGLMALETIKKVKKSYPEVHAICGLSNISFGLPHRALLNQAFTIMCMTVGLDAVILDPTDQRIMNLITAGKVLLNRDQYCQSYINAYRKGLLQE